ncbi:hypothetical protein KC19_4G252000 [Ceratodon purpureus]|uniref:Uncharacterized protein n=1 Tax=Ceratodon purpureus TaxID=3225 RepID=A0A8T0IEX7_CERPU|nr:hypothetical protein KC19_4G252000 [Ceratodon purpureus]
MCSRRTWNHRQRRCAKPQRRELECRTNATLGENAHLHSPLPTHTLTSKHSDCPPCSPNLATATRHCHRHTTILLSVTLCSYCHRPWSAPPCLPGHHRREGQSHWPSWQSGGLARRALLCMLLFRELCRTVR